MIQFNLLPDVKLEYIKTQRTKRLVMSLSFLLSAACLAVFILLVLSVDVLQKKNITDLSTDISTYGKKLKKTPNLDKILTVQNQLNSLTGLHNQKSVASRLSGFIGQVTPATATISELDADFTANTVTITGKAASLDTVNTFVDSLKFTKYTVDNSGDSTKAFSGVVLTSFARSSTDATYTINLSFDPQIFSNATDVSLIVPSITTTRSVVDHPTALFEGTNQ